MHSGPNHFSQTGEALYPLIQPAIEEIAEQVCETQSLDEVSLSQDTPYTSRLILDAVREAVEKAAVP